MPGRQRSDEKGRMKIEFVSLDTKPGPTTVLAVFAHDEGQLSPPAQETDRALSGAITRAIQRGRFKGGLGQTLDLVAPQGVDAARVLVVGVGKEDAFDGRTAELAAAHAYNTVKVSGAETLLFNLGRGSAD